MMKQILTLGLVLLMISPVFGQDWPDYNMGDFRGEFTDVNGKATALCAQVIALGKGEYHVIFLPEFDKRVAKIAELDGKLDGDAVVFKNNKVNAKIENKKFSGTLNEQAFELEHVIRMSPTMAKQPPENAVVLLGKDASVEGWRQLSRGHQIINLHQANAKSAEKGRWENCCVYLETWVMSPKAQKARLELGSDDGIKVWLNKEMIHDNHAARAVGIGNDKVDVKLKKGINHLLVKVTQGTGDWGMVARIVRTNGRQVPGLKVYKDKPAKPDSEMGSMISVGPYRGFILSWNISAPYTKENISWANLLKTPFEPEESGVGDGGKWYHRSHIEETDCRWKPIENGFEVIPGSGDVVSKKALGSMRFHAEFRTSFMPEKRGQGRANSGFYIMGRYELQVLDSYGLKGVDNECGGIYKTGSPLVNMARPPMQWQTYDIDFDAPKFDASGKKIAPAKITVRHNGVLIQDNLTINKPTGGAIGSGEVAKGPLKLQDHGNVIQFRNVWAVEK